MSNNMDEADMRPNAKRALVPALRFPEFQDAGEWEEKKLGEVCHILQGYGFPEVMQGKQNGKFPFFKVSDISRAVNERHGLLTEAANYVDDSDLSKLRAKPMPKGATVFAKIGEALRLNRRAITTSECLVDNNAVGLKAINGLADDYYIYTLSQLIDLNEYCGGAVPSVNKSTLEGIAVSIPSPSEQQKIADCLSSIDELITLEAQKIDALKAHKKGLMQQLFPAEGETLPKLRFPEFRDAGEWEIVPMRKLLLRDPEYGVNAPAIPYSEDRPTYLRITDIDDCGNFLSGSKVSVDINPFDDNFLKQGDIVLARTGASVGKSYRYKEKDGRLVFAGFLIRIRPEPTKTVPVFLSNFLTSQQYWNWVAATSTRSGQPGINGMEYASLPVPLPPANTNGDAIAEQQKIADCLSSIDDTIALEVQKIDTLRAHKKGLMQQLFPSIDEVTR